MIYWGTVQQAAILHPVSEAEDLFVLYIDTTVVAIDDDLLTPVDPTSHSEDEELQEQSIRVARVAAARSAAQPLPTTWRPPKILRRFCWEQFHYGVFTARSAP
jgi:hypothetical protein